MLLTVLVAWLVCGLLAAILVAAIGRSALREDQALGHVPAEPVSVLRGAADVAAPDEDVRGNPLSAGHPWGTLRA